MSLSEKLTKLRDAKHDPKLKGWGGQDLPALKHHLEMAQTLDKSTGLFSGASVGFLGSGANFL